MSVRECVCARGAPPRPIPPCIPTRRLLLCLPPRRPRSHALPLPPAALPCPAALQVQRAVAHQVHRDDHRDTPRLLPHAAPLANAVLRLHSPRDWPAGKRIWRCISALSSGCPLPLLLLDGRCCPRLIAHCQPVLPCRARMRMLHATPTEGTQWRQWGSASIWPRMLASRWG